MSSFVKEFKDFAMRGNVVDMAVGIVIGAGFGKIVTSLVNDIVMPPLGIVIGGVNFKDLSITLKQAVDSTPAVTLNYGAFIQSVFDFTIVAFSIFLLIKLMNSLQREKKVEPSAPPTPPKEELLLTEIRDILKSSAGR